MTDSNFCCLCASDEGVFLDIFTSSHRQLGNRSFVNEFEACLSLKVDRDAALSTTVCHRCAIELGQCSQFIQRYNRTYQALTKLKESVAKKSCCFCLTTASSNFLFTLAKDFRSSIHPLQKIYECFDRRITREEAESRLICLSCRYNLDLLYDLRKLAREVDSKLQRIAESRAILASLPKTETFVVNRKTTLICQSKVEIEELQESESEEETMARKRSCSKRAGKSIPVPAAAKLRTCGQCQTAIEGGIDMYRLHSTGVTICKLCWITMDPLNNNRTNKRRRQSHAEVKNTRLCAVFLKDVLTDPPTQTEKKGPSKVDKNTEEETIVISDGSEDEDEPLSETLKNVRARRSRRVQSSERERNSNSNSNSNSNLRSKRSLKSEESDGGSKKKLKTAKMETPATNPSGLRRSARYQSSDSDNVKGKGKAEKTVESSKPEETNSRNKLGGKEPKKSGGNKARVVSKGEDSSSSNGDVGRASRKVRNKVPLIIKPESLQNSWKAQTNVKEEEPTSRVVLRKRCAVQKKLIIESINKNQPSSKAKRIHSLKRPKNLMTVSFPFKIRNPYECKVCGTEYRNKIIGMKHELTHFNQVEIKIQKLNVNRNFQNNDQNSRTTDIQDDTGSINEKLTPTRHEELDSGKEAEESTHPTDNPESIHREDESQEAKVPDDASSTNGLPTEESTSSPPDDSKKESAENFPPDSNVEKEIPNSIEKVAEESTMDSNGTGVEDIEAVDETEVKETDKEVKEKVDREKDAEDKSEETDTFTASAGKNADEEKESGEEMESDTDIRIVDTGSSGEESNQRSEKVADDVPATEEIADSIKDDDNSKSLNDDKAEEEKTASKIDTVDAEADSLKNGEPGKEEEAESEPGEKVEGEETPISAVTEILQEVMDLATAEVQKRFDSGVASLPETLENISDEINKTGDESPAVEKTGVYTEADSAELESNSANNTLENYLELGNTEV